MIPAHVASPVADLLAHHGFPASRAPALAADVLAVIDAHTAPPHLSIPADALRYRPAHGGYPDPPADPVVWVGLDVGIPDGQGVTFYLSDGTRLDPARVRPAW